MKPLAQCAALFLLALFTAQPGIAALTCAPQGSLHCSSGCPMAMASKAPACPMASSMASGACAAGCCATADPQPLPRPASPQLVAAANPALVLSAPPAPPAAATVAARVSVEPFASPPLYLLHRVFRI